MRTWILAVVVACAGSAQTGRIGGRIEDQTGAVIAGANLTLYSTMGNRTAPSGPTGDFVFQDLPAGRYPMVSIVVDGFRPYTLRSIVVDEGARLDLGSITLRVLSLEEMGLARSIRVLRDTPVTGNLLGRVGADRYEVDVSGALVELECVDGTVCKKFTTTVDGKFRFDGLPAGPYRMKIQAPGYYRGEFRVEVDGGFETEYGWVPLEACVTNL